MKAFFLVLAGFLLAASANAQTEIIYEPGGNKIIKGLMTRTDLDTAYQWFGANKQSYKPNEKAVETFKSNKDGFQMIVFGGTWCGDTKSLLPQFYALTDAAGYPDQSVTLIGVDRAKTSLHNLTQAFAVTNVPTFIVMKNGKEVGRVVEWGKTGQVDKELAEIVEKAK